MSRITEPGELREFYPEPKERALGKVLHHIDSYFVRFIELSPFCIVGTVHGHGHPEISPRGGEPGFVKVIDERTLLLPDRPGNNRLDSLSNLTRNPSLALLFMVPGIDETLRVYGTAEVLADPELSEEFTVNERAPKVVLRVTVSHAYFQCAKSLLRARLWSEDIKVDRKSFPTLGEILKEQMRSDAPAESQEQMLERYKKDL